MTDFLSTTPDMGLPGDRPASGIVTLTRFSNPLEAQVLHGLLVSEGIAATLGDFNQVQTNTLWATALGGVRVMVPAAHLARAQALLAEMQSGALAIEGDADPDLPAPPVSTDAELWSPDLAAVFSIWLTPVFGATLHLVNAMTLHDRALVTRARAWLVLSVLATAAGFWLLRDRDWTNGRPFEVSAVVFPFSVIWYFASAHVQSRHIARSFGTRYPHRSVLTAVAIAFVIQMALGTAGTMVAGD